ncbi:Murein endopeptidase [Minicystis rosea]|nr:Murein endopeptidase [Minicystis rosea]
MWSSQGRIARAIALAIALVTVPVVAVAAPGHKSKAAAGKKSKGEKTKGGKGKARSVGAPNHGRLEGAALLKQNKTLKQREGSHSWALPQMVGMLHHAANSVARKHKGSVMFVGDLSGKTGGHLDRHGSHQTGRDADVGFYVVNSKGKSIPVKRFIAFDDAGNARDVPGARFDEARNWSLVEAFLKDRDANVRYLFVTNGLRARLLAYAAKKHAPKELIERASTVMMSPPDADLHDDHFHVRIACPDSMRDVCIEESTAREPKADAPSEAKADADDGKPAHAKNDAAEDAKQP